MANGPALLTWCNDAQSNCLSPPQTENSPRQPPPLHMMSTCISVLRWRGWSRKAAAIKLGRWWKPKGETLQGGEWVVGGVAHDGCWVRCTHCSDYEARGASGNYEAWGASGNYIAWGASGNYKARGASGGKYKARMVIFCILATVNRFSWISWKEESH